ncbi:ketopantoate reductase family protein [Paracidovorax avenae]|uniref:ketopantoate reductase family protein n=1 Tax=Paracidovorax avenae TaxID=80867 RepID=UPI001863C898|nr:ketopantoate reductase family protein [Paracidovorax avenae]
MTASPSAAPAGGLPVSPPDPAAPPLRIAVMGAGAVGCYFGALLARAGHAVTLIGRPAHVEAIRANGLRLQTATLDEQVPMAADTDPAAVRGADVVMFCVKSTDTEDAARQIQPHLAPGALVLTLQNGVDNDERVRGVLGGDAAQPVAAAVVYVATEMAGPGHVRHHGRGELVIAPSPLSATVAQQFSAAGIATEISDNVRGALWAKLVLNCAYNAISALAQQPYGRLVQAPGVADVIADVVAECLAVAEADGIQIPGDVGAAVDRIAATMPGQMSSTAQDLARGKPSEIDHLNGYVVARGKAVGVGTPVNRVLWVLVKVVEAKRVEEYG